MKTSVELTGREVARAFLRSRFLAGGMVAELLGYECTWFHREWREFQHGRQKSLLLAPRGHGKSTILTVSFALEKIAADRDVRILIVSNTAEQARAFLREIKQHLEANSALLGAYGPFVGSPWTDHEIVVAGRRRIAKEATVTALGAGGPVISRHYDVVILDDVVDEESSRSARQREDTLTWFYKTLLPALEPGGEIHLLGTRYHHLDLYGRLLENEYRDHHRVYCAIRETPAGQAALWEEKFPLALLRQKREAAGPAIFNSQYQNDVAAMQGLIFRRPWIREWNELPAGLKKFQGVDLAIAQHNRADYFAHVTLGLDQHENLYLLEAFRGRLSFDEQYQAIVRRYRKFDRPESPVLRVGIEANAYQAVLPDRLRRESAVPVKAVLTLTDKITRALRLQGTFENGKVFFPAPRLAAPSSGEEPSANSGVTDLTEELLAFPEGLHDDLFDAFEIAASLAHSTADYRELAAKARKT